MSRIPVKDFFDDYTVECVDRYKQSGELGTHLSMMASLMNSRIEDMHPFEVAAMRREFPRVHALERVNAQMDKIKDAARLFQSTHWYARLQKYVQDSKSRGHSADGDGFRALLWSCAGRVLLTIQDAYPRESPLSCFDGAQVTLIFLEDEIRPCGVQSVAATCDEACRLLECITNVLPEFRPDNGVTVG